LIEGNQAGKIEGLLNAADVASLLGVTEQSVFRIAHEQRIGVVRLGGAIRFRRCDVEEYRANQRRKRSERPADGQNPPC
jgi:excisionase family DNA binding protein